MRGRLLKEHELTWWYTDFLMKDFPANEIKPLEDIKQLYAQGKYEIHIYQSRDEEYIGYATLWTATDCHTYLLDYLGVRADRRGQTIGQQILEDIGGNLLTVDHKACLLCEAEMPADGTSESENHLRERRINFYKRNHYIKIYEMATCGLRFAALAYRDVPCDIQTVMAEHRAIYGPHRHDVIVPLEKGQTPPKPYWMQKK